MHGLPATFDPGVFVGRRLDQVSFTENTVHFQFDGGISITVLSSFLVKLGDKRVEERVPVRSSEVMRLVGKVVRLADARPDGMLKVTFDGGEMLTFIDDSAQYESYQLRIGDREIYV